MATRKKKYKPSRAKSPALRKKKKPSERSYVRSRAKPAASKTRKKTPQKVVKRRSRPQKSVKRGRDKKGRFLAIKKKISKRTQKVKPSKRQASKSKAPLKKLLKQPKTLFRKIRQKNLKKIPKATRPKRRGSLTMRGAEGQERSIIVKKFWDKINDGLLEEELMTIYQSLLRSSFHIRPSLYTRFTFSVSNVETIMSAGSPKMLGVEGGKIKAWFFSTGLAYTLDGARIQLQKGFDVLSDAIDDAQNENPNAKFFLEFATCRGYVVN